MRSVWRINTSPFPGEFCAACQTYYEGEYNDLKTVKVNGRKVKRCVCGATDGWVSHFATFCLELPMTIIPIATSEKGVCAKCGSPWAPKVETGEVVPLRGNSTIGPGYQTLRDQKHCPGYVPSRITGWMQTCTCEDAGDPVPATVMDMYSGAATTGVAAVKLGREYLGLELSPIYAEMSRQRLARAANPTTFSKADAPDDAPLLALMGEGDES